MAMIPHFNNGEEDSARVAEGGKRHCNMRRDHFCHLWKGGDRFKILTNNHWRNHCDKLVDLRQRTEFGTGRPGFEIQFAT